MSNEMIQGELENEDSSGQKGYLTLPFNEDQFKSFIAALLGNPQTITRRIYGLFDLDIKDLQNFHDLILQRLQQQNKSRLIQMQTQIYYSDESSVLLSSYDELITYNEVKPVVSEAVKMTWTFLIQFEDKKVPEKQEIELTIVAGPQGNVFESEISPIVRWFGQGQFTILIKHTARSWGSDIESLLTNQINSLTLHEKKWRKYFRRKSTTIGILSGLFSFFAVSIGVYIANARFVRDQINTTRDILTAPHIDTDKLNFIIQFVTGSSQNLLFFKSLCFMVLSIFASILIAVWVSSLAEEQSNSYLVLSRESEKIRQRSKQRAERRTLIFCSTMVLNVVLSVLASYLFIFLSKFWSI